MVDALYGGIGSSPRVTPVNCAVPSAFCVTPVNDTNSWRVECPGSIVPHPKVSLRVLLEFEVDSVEECEKSQTVLLLLKI